MIERPFAIARTLLFFALIGAVIGWAGPTMAGHEFEGKSPLADGDDGDVEYPSSVSKYELEAELELPDDIKGKVPAMIIAHGSGGVDDREEDWAEFFQEKGIASFVIDYFGPRGIDKNSRRQPMPDMDIADALAVLSTHPKIDPDRIGVIGFSRGAHLSIMSTDHDADFGAGHVLAAHVALYPTCRRLGISEGGSGGPILILIGTKDSYGKPENCERLVKVAKENKRDARVIIYEGAYHAWDGDYSGKWFHKALRKEVEFKEDDEITKQSRQDVLEFLKGPLKL